MFLLNSRRPLVSATYKSSFEFLLRKDVGTPYPEVTGPICRIPLLWFSCHALAFSARVTCTGSRYDRTKHLLHPFHGPSESAQALRPARDLAGCSSQRDFSGLFRLDSMQLLSLSAGVGCNLALPLFAFARWANINALPFRHHDCV